MHGIRWRQWLRLYLVVCWDGRHLMLSWFLLWMPIGHNFGGDLCPLSLHEFIVSSYHDGGRQ